MGVLLLDLPPVLLASNQPSQVNLLFFERSKKCSRIETGGQLYSDTSPYKVSEFSMMQPKGYTYKVDFIRTLHLRTK